MIKSEAELIEIADRMLADLEKEYWQVQQCNINPRFLCPENQDEEEIIDHQGYQSLDADGEEELQDSEQDEEEEQGNKVSNGELEKGEIQKDEQVEKKGEIEDRELEDYGEMMEVFPTQEWVPVEKEIEINSQKIKAFTLGMNLPIPSWVYEEESLKGRINELFGKHK